jgi:hypothetical protein
MQELRKKFNKEQSRGTAACMHALAISIALIYIVAAFCYDHSCKRSIVYLPHEQKTNV